MFTTDEIVRVIEMSATVYYDILDASEGDFEEPFNEWISESVAGYVNGVLSGERERLV